MFITFNSITIRDFLSHADTRFEFRSGITIVDGKNEDNLTGIGSGKSTIFDALIWGLYGYHPKGLRLDEVARFGTKNAIVDVDFSGSDGHTYKAVRSSNPSSLLFYIDGQLATFEHKNAAQGKLESVLGCDVDGFLYSTYFTQENSNHFLQLDPASRKNVLFKIIGIDKLDIVFEAVKEDIKSIATNLEIEEYNDKEVIAHIADTESTIKIYKEKLNNYTKEREIELAGLDKELKEIDDKLEELTLERKSLQMLDDDIEKLEKEGSSIRKEIKKIENLRINRASMVQEVASLESTLDKLNKELKDIESDGSPCPYCRRPLDYQWAADQKKFIKGEIKKTEADIAKLRKDIGDIEHYVSVNAPLADKNLKDVLERINNNITVPQRMVNNDKMQKAYSDRKMSIKQQRGKLLIKDNEYVNIVKDFNLKLRDALKKKIDIDEKIESLKCDLELHKRLSVAFGPHGIKSFILDGILSELNHTIKEYLSALYEENVDMIFTMLEITTRDYKKTYKIDSRCYIDGEEWTFNALSGGEKRRAILAVDMAIAKIVTKRYNNWFNVFMLDEVTTSLDDASRGKFYDLLQLLSADRNIMLIDHAQNRHEIKNANIVTVVKEGGISRIK
jgi:DNA repair exonuclease SbcCD ATPase subunit